MSNVNHPTHYNLPGRKECIVEMEELFGLEATATFCLMNAYKYLYRAGNKVHNSKEQDVDKAMWYFEWVKNRGSELNTDDTANFDNLFDLYKTVRRLLYGK